MRVGHEFSGSAVLVRMFEAREAYGSSTAFRTAATLWEHEDPHVWSFAIFAAAADEREAARRAAASMVGFGSGSARVRQSWDPARGDLLKR